jgi:hypothetical protein
MREGLDHQLPQFRTRVTGDALVLTLEVDDAEAALREVETTGIVPAVSLRDEPWGQRHFMLRDPAGVWVDVVQPIDPDPSSWTRRPVSSSQRSTNRPADRERPVRGPNAERQARTHAALLVAARRVFSRDGFASATTGEIMAGTGLTRGAIYYHFPDKLALLAERADSEPDLDSLTALLSGALNEAALWIADADDQAAARRAMRRSLDTLLDRLFSRAAAAPTGPGRGRGAPPG